MLLTRVRILAAKYKVVGNIYPSLSICEANIDTSEWNENVAIEKKVFEMTMSSLGPIRACFYFAVVQEKVQSLPLSLKLGYDPMN